MHGQSLYRNKSSLCRTNCPSRIVRPYGGTPVRKRNVVLVFALSFIAVISVRAQQQRTDTTCMPMGAEMINCTSTTTPTGPTPAEMQQQAEQQRQQQKDLDESASKIGNSLGLIIAQRRAQHAQEKSDLTAVTFCRQNPGGSWTFPGKGPMPCTTFEKNVLAYCTVNAKTTICKDVAKLPPAAAMEAAQPPQPPPVAAREASASIDPPLSNTNSGFSTRWKSLTSNSDRILRVEGDYIYAERIFPEDAAKAGMFSLTDFKKDGDRYTGKARVHILKTAAGPACSFTLPVELTLVTTDRIEGREFVPPLGAKLDWNTCTYSTSSDWQDFVWIPVR
jgi:hypothetical protein